jgi:hypothetical protein
MMIHPEFERVLIEQRLESLRRDGRRPLRPRAPQQEDLSRIELRLCTVGDDEALGQLAALSERELPHGSFVLAHVNGRLVAAMALCTGLMLADPFVRTAHIRRLLELRARQLQPAGPRFHLPWPARRSLAA